MGDFDDLSDQQKQALNQAQTELMASGTIPTTEETEQYDKEHTNK